MHACAAGHADLQSAKASAGAQADQRRSKQIKNWTYDDDDDGPRWPPANLANHSFDGARSGSPQLPAGRTSLKVATQKPNKWWCPRRAAPEQKPPASDQKGFSKLEKADLPFGACLATKRLAWQSRILLSRTSGSIWFRFCSLTFSYCKVISEADNWHCLEFVVRVFASPRLAWLSFRSCGAAHLDRAGTAYTCNKFRLVCWSPPLSQASLVLYCHRQLLADCFFLRNVWRNIQLDRVVEDVSHGTPLTNGYRSGVFGLPGSVLRTGGTVNSRSWRR